MEKLPQNPDRIRKKSKGLVMGIYRLLLAVAVLLSHIRVTVLGREIGVIAVISFFVISGYVMTALIDKSYPGVERTGTFYLDRAMRLFPQFLLYFALTLLLAWIAHPSSFYLSGITPAKLMLNLTMLPLNFYTYFTDCLIIPQAWSLGLESQFYLVIPFILAFRARAVAFALSAAFFSLPLFGIIDSDTWGYRMLPATLFMFIFGSFLRRNTSVRAVISCYIATCGLFGYVVYHPELQRPYIFEVLFGMVVGIPVVYVLSKFKLGRVDEFTGNLSYGLFLNHRFVMLCFQVAGLSEKSSLYIPALLGVSLILAWLSYELIEKRVIAIRHKIRNRNLSESGRLPPAENSTVA
ncbi:acyltransferase family protein [Burkholderia anthina]|uniref:acyltransferase family protein n=1 Tax=Burkholderia anthina TaxID=179879 RepID=UPI0012D87DD0|nr:acyltransferase [Burkholderia anthina]